MADEPNIPRHRFYQETKHVRLPKNAVTKTTLLDAAVTKVDAQ